MGDYMQSIEDISSTSTEIRIYEGADGQCTLYEDEGNNYNYENGVFSKIDFHWNDKRKHLILVRSKGNLKVCSHI
jgi:alpha-D-xyloside xylohydrolase